MDVHIKTQVKKETPVWVQRPCEINEKTEVNSREIKALFFIQKKISCGRVNIFDVDTQSKKKKFS